MAQVSVKYVGVCKIMPDIKYILKYFKKKTSVRSRVGITMELDKSVAGETEMERTQD